MMLSFPSYPAWVVKGIYKELKTGVKDVYNKVKEISEGFYFMIRGSIIGLYIINAALLGFEDKRVKKHGHTLKGMRQIGGMFWLIVIGSYVILISSVFGIILFFISAFLFISYDVYMDQKEEFRKTQSSQFSKKTEEGS